MPPSIPKPWDAFLAELDQSLPEPVELHCLGGFVVSVHYGVGRPTADVDVLQVKPSTARSWIDQLAGKGSPLYRKHKVYLQQVTVLMAYPEDYEQRLAEMFPGTFGRLRLLALDPYDLALTKLERNRPRDREDVFSLAETVPLDVGELRKRYEDEMRSYVGNPEREGATLEYWIEAIGERRSKKGP